MEVLILGAIYFSTRFLHLLAVFFMVGKGIMYSVCLIAFNPFPTNNDTSMYASWTLHITIYNFGAITVIRFFFV